MSKRSAFPRKPGSTSRKPERGKLRNGDYLFAKSFNMLTNEEIEACENGNAEVSGSKIFNANANLSFSPGTWNDLYQDRRTDILADRLLGLNQNN